MRRLDEILKAAQDVAVPRRQYRHLVDAEPRLPQRGADAGLSHLRRRRLRGRRAPGPSRLRGRCPAAASSRRARSGALPPAPLQQPGPPHPPHLRQPHRRGPQQQPARPGAFSAWRRPASSRRSPGLAGVLGPSGCGKTHVAAAIANRCIQQGQPALFVVVPDLLDHLRGRLQPRQRESPYDEFFEQVRSAPSWSSMTSAPRAPLPGPRRSSSSS